MKIWIVGPIALDSVLFLDSSFTDSGYIHVRKKTERPGGQGLNVATGLKSASLDVQLVGYLGNDSNAQKLLQVILALGLTSDYLARVDAPSPHIMVLVDSSGERKMVGLERSFYETVRLPLENIKSGDIVIWTWWRKEFTEDFKVCKSIRATTVVGLEALQDSNIEADLFIGSEVELPKVEIPKDKKVIVTVGAKGAKFFDSGEISEIPARAADVVDTTGAGDALLAGVVFGLAKGFDIKKSLNIGVNWSSATISSESSLPAKWSEKYIIG